MQTVVIRIRGDSKKGYTVALAVEGGPFEHETPFPAPDAAEAEAIRRLILDQNKADKRFKHVGQSLWQRLRDTEAGRRWLELREQAQPPELRTLLDLEEAADLRALPWELLYDDTHRLFRLREFPVARGRLLGGARPKLERWPQNGPIKVLVVVGSDPKAREVEADEELQRIGDATHDLQGLLHIERLDQPSPGDLADAFRYYRPHVFHFIGHGGSAGGEAFLPVKTAGAPWACTSDHIQDCLDVCLPWLVILNACRSSLKEPDKGAAASRSVAETFLRNRVPAVLGMQADVRGTAAARLSAPLYRALACGEALDVALAEARWEIGKDLGVDLRDWCVPCLSFTMAPDQVRPPEQPQLFARYEGVKNDFNDLMTFVDRTPERRTVCFGAEPIDDRERPGRRVFVVTGGTQAGKTWLVRWCMKAWQVWGWQVIYAGEKYLGRDDTGEASPDVLELLRRLQTACRARLGGGPGPFSRFNHELTHLPDLARGRPAPALPGGPVEESDESRRRPWQQEYGRAVPGLLRSFLDALRAVAAGRALALVIDPLRLDPGHFPFLLDDLIDPVARDTASPLRLVLVVAAKDQKWSRLKPELEGLVHNVRVPLFRQDDFVAYAEEFWRHQNIDVQAVRLLIDYSRQQLKGDWEPRILADMKAYHQKFQMFGGLR
jgi:hypothetical protein